MACPKNCGGACPFPSEGISFLRKRKQDIEPSTAFIEVPLTRCVKCKAAVASTDAVLDALRVGQEALQKATRLQFSGNG